MRLSDEAFVALVQVALSSEAELAGRVGALADFAEVCARAKDADCVEAALAEGLRVLNEAPRNSDAGDLSSEALRFGRRAEQLDRPALARDVYEVGLAALEHDPANPILGVLWHAIGDTWAEEGNGERALDSFRTAVTMKRSGDPRSRIISLASLIGAEAKWGLREMCEPLIREGIQALETAVGMSSEMADDTGLAAHGLGRAAEMSGYPTLARRVYELTLGLIEFGFTPPTPGVVWEDIGDTWIADDEGPQALKAFREAARRRCGEGNEISCAASLTDLAGAELEWGERPACESAVEKGVGMLEEAATSSRTRPELLVAVATVLGELAELIDRPELADAARVHADANPIGDQPIEGIR